MRDLATLRQWLSEQDTPPEAIVFDIDGVVFNKGRLIDGAPQALELLSVMGVSHVFLTNDGDHSPLEKSAMIRKAGLMVEPEHIVSCAHGLALVAREENLTGELFFLLGDLGDPCYAHAAGLATTRSFRDLDKCRGVVLGEGHFDWERGLNQIVNFLRHNPERLLLVPNPDDFYPGGQGLIEIGAGGLARFVQRMLELNGVNISPRFLGKPFEPIYAHTHKKLCRERGMDIPRDRVLMVGDNLKSDIAGARNFGYRSALVMSGVTSPAMLEASRLKPDYVLKSV